MKIIGKTSGGFIIEASESEVSQLVGYSSAYSHSMAVRRSNGPVQVGDVIQVSEMYSSLTMMATLEKRMAEARGILTTVAGGLTMVDPIIREVNAALVSAK